VQYDPDIDLAQRIAAEALERIDKESLAPTPDAYAVWYVYYSGRDPDITRAVDILVAKEKKVSQERCAELYGRFIGKESNEEFMKKAGDLMNETLLDMSSMMANVQSATTQYSGSLEDASKISSSASSPAEMQKVLQNMMAETQKILQENKALEEKLDKSSSSIQKLKNEMESVKKEAVTDGLTGLPNRKLFDMEIDRIMAEAREKNTKMCLLVMDIDHFKNFNDTYGHQVGDQVLRLVGKTLQQGVKGKDVAARYGGEEFCAILPETDKKAAFSVAESLRLAVANKEVINRSTGEKLGKITMSIGLAEYNRKEKVAELIERADTALYKAKHAGRNNVQIAEN